jgi:hypothetical protein
VAVPETMLGAQLFFRALGFSATGVLRDHCDGRDAYAMRYAVREYAEVGGEG